MIVIDDNLRVDLSKSELRVVQYINNNEEKIVDMSIIMIAQNCYTSTATVSRTIKKVGFPGLNELRYEISKQQNSEKLKFEIHDIIYKSQVEVNRTLENVDLNSLINAVNLIKESRYIYVFTMGLTSFIGEEFTLKLNLLNIKSVSITDPNIIKKLPLDIESTSTCVIFTLNGHKDELIEAAQILASRNIDLITCCCSNNTTLMDYSNIYLAGYHHKHKSFDNYEVSSRLSLSVLSRLLIDYLNTVISH